MDSRKKIEDFLKKWTNTPSPPKFGVLIEGNWGAGKTHFIKSILENKSFTKKNTIYLSLFGVNSIRDLETLLFFSSANAAQKSMHRGASIIGTLLKGTLRFDLDGDDKSDGSINANLKGLNKIVEKLSNNLDDALIIFDDLERCTIPMTEFLGFANQFIEHGDSRILFVANTEKIEDEKKRAFHSFKEKVIGHHFKLKAQPNEALKYFVNEVDNEAINKILLTQSEQIIELFYKSGHQNLRALRQFIWHYTALLEAINHDYRSNTYFLQNLTEQFFVFFTEFKLDLGGGGLTPKDLISGKHTSASSAIFALNTDKNQKPSEKYKALSKYKGSFGAYDAVIPVTAFIDILQSGLIEPDVLNQHLSKSKYLQSSTIPAWLQLISFEKLEDEVVELAKKELFNQFENRDLHEVGAMLHMFALRFMMSENGIIQDNFQKVELSCRQYVDDLLSSGDLPRRPTDWKWSQGLSSEGNHGYSYRITNAYRENFSNVQQYLDEARAQAFENQIADVAQEILTALKTDPKQFVELISYGLGGGKYASVPVMQAINVEDFVETWLSLPKSSWLDIRYAIDSRYKGRKLQTDEHHTGELVDEKNWVIELRTALEDRAAALGGFKKLRITRIVPSLPKE